MQRRQKLGLRHLRKSRKKDEGIIIVLVAIFMLFVVGAMAVLAIDVTTFYTARSEGQIAADGAALAAARVLANAGITSLTGNPTAVSTAQGWAQNVAYQVAQSNPVGGRNLVQSNGEVVVTFPTTCGSGAPNSFCVTVQVKRADLPTFFARIWGSTVVTVGATATAEAYNPSGLATGPPPVAPTCVKPWLLPNLDPLTGNKIFDTTTGAIQDYGLVTGSPTTTPLQVACGNGYCSSSLHSPAAPWQYLPGDTTRTFLPPPAASVTCSPSVGGFSSTDYQLSIAGCVQGPISCNSPVFGTSVYADLSDYGAPGTRESETAHAVNCLTHTEGGQGDTVDTTNNNPPPFEFLTGADNPFVTAGTGLSSNTDVFVSDSVVTVPVFDNTTSGWPPTGAVPVVGFVQLFLSPSGQRTHARGASAGVVSTTVINMIGCGTGATGTPAVYGNGPSAVPVRLITPP